MLQERPYPPNRILQHRLKGSQIVEGKLTPRHKDPKWAGLLDASASSTKGLQAIKIRCPKDAMVNGNSMEGRGNSAPLKYLRLGSEANYIVQYLLIRLAQQILFARLWKTLIVRSYEQMQMDIA